MYQTLAKEWLKTNCHLHLIAHFSHNILLKETLYQLGFGALVAERVRDLSPIDGVQYQKIKEEKDISKLVDLHIEHILYYSQSPIFIPRTIEHPSALADLQSHVQNEDVLFVAYEQGQPCAYLIVGKSPIGSEGFLLQNTNSAQVKSAYAQPEVRDKGIGTALLNHAIGWAKQKGFERIFVEHETANIPGGNFWRKYFTPYLYFSMRYIDTTL